MKHHTVAIVTDESGNAIPLNPAAFNSDPYLTFPSGAVERCAVPWRSPDGAAGFWLEETSNGWLVIVKQRVASMEVPPKYGYETVTKFVATSSSEALLYVAARMSRRPFACEPSTAPVDERHAPYLPRPFPPKDTEVSWSKEVDDIFGSVVPK